MQSIFLKPPGPNEILNIIHSLNIDKASGNDDISFFFLRLGGKVLAPILSVYFGYALEHRIFPDIFKTAKIIPLFKSGSKENVNNYRPISQLPSLPKVLEKLIKFRLVKVSWIFKFLRFILCCVKVKVKGSYFVVWWAGHPDGQQEESS